MAKNDELKAERVEAGLTLSNMATNLTCWYATQSERLGLTREELEAAVLCGWPGDWIEVLPAAEAHLLAGKPGANMEAVERIRNAPVKAIPMEKPHASGRSEHHVNKRQRKPQNNSMAEAFKQAARDEDVRTC